MVQNTVVWLERWFSNWFSQLIPLFPWVLGTGGVLLAFGLVLYALNKDALTASSVLVWSRVKQAGVWLPIVFALSLASLGLTVAREAFALRFSNQQNAQFSKLEDPSGGQTVQSSPTANFEVIQRFTRTFTVQPDFARQLGNDPERVLQGYLGYQTNFNGVLKSVQDGLKRDKGTILFTRTYTVAEFKPIALEAADVSTGFEFGDTGAGRSYYRTVFTGKYILQNPLKQDVNITFNFPLPANSGTLSDFEFLVAGQKAVQSDLSSGYFTWQGNVAANAKLEFLVKYKNQGSSTWSYDFGERREPIKNFVLKVTSPRSVKFLRGSLYPTNQVGALEWNLKNIITSQSVVLSFPELSLRETLLKLFRFSDAALLLLLVWSVLFGWSKGLTLEPKRFALAVLALAVGIGAAAVLLGYVSPVFAIWLGAIIAAFVGVLALGTPYALPVILSSLSPLAFLSGGNAGLWLVLLALIVVSSLLPKDSLSRLQGLLPKSKK
jgi:hypothetical protein